MGVFVSLFKYFLKSIFYNTGHLLNALVLVYSLKEKLNIMIKLKTGFLKVY